MANGGTGSYAMALANAMAKNMMIANLETRLMQASAEKNVKHMAMTAQIGVLSSKMSDLVNQKKKELGDNPSSEDYRQNMIECESIENEYTMLIQNITNQMEQVEEKIQLEQTVTEDRLKVAREEYQQWKELANAKAENNHPFT